MALPVKNSFSNVRLARKIARLNRYRNFINKMKADQWFIFHHWSLCEIILSKNAHEILLLIQLCRHYKPCNNQIRNICIGKNKFIRDC